MTDSGNGRLTLAGVVFGDGYTATALGDELGQGSALGAAGPAFRALGRGMRKAVLRGIADQIARVLDRDVIDVLGAGWRKHEALTSAGRRTLATPGAEEIVELADHRISSNHRPRIDVILD